MECKCRLVDTVPFGQFKFCLKYFGSIILLEISKTVNMEVSERESRKNTHGTSWFLHRQKKVFCLYSLLYILYHRPL